MAGANTDVVQRGLDAFNRREMDAWLDCFDPEVEVNEDPSGRFGSIFTFRNGRVARWRVFAGWGEAMEAEGLVD